MYAKIALKLFVAMPNNKLPTNFQLNIFIFKAKVRLHTLLQSLKQNTNMGHRKKNYGGKKMLKNGIFGLSGKKLRLSG